MIHMLPKYDKDACIKGWFDTSMPDMNLENPFVLRYFTQMAVWWVEYGLGGIRVDTFSTLIKLQSPMGEEHPQGISQMNTVGECWYGDPLCMFLLGGVKQRRL